MSTSQKRIKNSSKSTGCSRKTSPNNLERLPDISGNGSNMQNMKILCWKPLKKAKLMLEIHKMIND